MASVLNGTGYVNLDGHYGTDLTVVNRARQSFNQFSEQLGDKERGLINYLMKNKHGSPFEMVDFTFNVKAPIFVAREWMRHRMGSYNEMSGRYTQMLPDCYVPAVDGFRRQVGSPGHYRFEKLGHPESVAAQTKMIEVQRKCWSTYRDLLTQGVAKEQARMVLPVSMMTRFSFKANLRSLFNFFALRNHEAAMSEIREYAAAMEEQVREVVPVCMEAFEKNGRQVP